VLLPVRDAAETLPACLDSLRGQTLRELEVVAVDDGSSDGSGELLEAAARDDPRFRVLRRPARGLVPTLAEACEAALAPLLARMDADDICHPDRLRLQAERLEEEPALDVLASRVRLLPLPGGSPGMAAYVEWQNGLLDHDAILRDRYVESPLVHPSVMLRAATVKALGGYRDHAGPEDYDLWLRAAAAGCRFAKLPEVLLDWRDSPGRLTRRDPRYAAARFLELKLASLEAGPLAARPPLVIWGAGPIGKAWARALRARGHRLAAFVEVAPGKLGQRIHGAPVLPVEQALVPAALHLAAVGQPGARVRIREAARALGLRDGEDLIAVA
jgi:hypothetical protein